MSNGTWDDWLAHFLTWQFVAGFSSLLLFVASCFLMIVALLIHCTSSVCISLYLILLVGAFISFGIFVGLVFHNRYQNDNDIDDTDAIVNKKKDEVNRTNYQMIP